MPAGSDAAPPALPRTWRPLGVRVAGTVLGLLVVGACAMAWVAFPPEVQDQFSLFQRGTVLFLGLLLLAVWFALVRSRLVATDAGLTVVNGYRRRDFEWAEVIAVHLPPGAPWAVLDLADGTSCPAMAIQGSDGARARRAVTELRSLLDR